MDGGGGLYAGSIRVVGLGVEPEPWKYGAQRGLHGVAPAGGDCAGGCAGGGQQRGAMDGVVCGVVRAGALAAALYSGDVRRLGTGRVKHLRKQSDGGPSRKFILGV